MSSARPRPTSDESVRRCCVGRLLAGSAVAVLYLDGELKFSEGRWKSMPRIDVHAELVVAST
jgi:hypothetical protein